MRKFESPDVVFKRVIRAICEKFGSLKRRGKAVSLRIKSLYENALGTPDIEIMPELLQTKIMTIKLSEDQLKALKHNITNWVKQTGVSNVHSTNNRAIFWAKINEEQQQKLAACFHSIRHVKTYEKKIITGRFPFLLRVKSKNTEQVTSKKEKEPTLKPLVFMQTSKLKPDGFDDGMKIVQIIFNAENHVVSKNGTSRKYFVIYPFGY